MVLHQLLQLQFLPLLVVLAGEPPLEAQPTHAHTEVLMNKMAKDAVEQQVAVSPSLGSLPSNTVNTTGPNVTEILLTFKDDKGLVLARLNMTSNFTLSLATTKCQGTVVDKFCCSAAADVSKCQGDDKWKYAGMVVKDKVFAVVPIKGIVNTSGVNKTVAYKRAEGDHRITNTSELTLTIQYTELWYNKTANLNYTPPTNASLELVITTEGENRADYWNVTKATLNLEGSYNKTIAYPTTTDVTANFGYTWAEPACTAPYAPCAPRGLAWTCNDQVFALTQNSLNDTYFTSINATTADAHLPDFRLRLGDYNKNATGEEFGWDCEPLIPISVWVSVLITIFLASILLWGVCMLAYLNTPTKFDDPKGPSIYVPAAE